MTEFTDLSELEVALEAALDGGRVKDPASFRNDLLDRLVWTAVFAKSEALRETARSAINEAAVELGARSASIQGLYEARGRGECKGFTVPAVNIRGMTYDVARALFRSMRDLDAGACIFEIARSEMGYTDQQPAEYATVVLAAAVREGHEGPVFIQGDHFQANPKKYAADPDGEIAAIRKLIDEAVKARFFNIDIDMSTLVDLSRPTIREQQRVNFTLAAELAAYIRQIEPEPVTVSIGGEIGEVGGKNSTVEEFRAYADGFLEELGKRGEHLKGMSKISVQTGTSHGGVPLPDGRVAEVAIDFDVLRSITEVAVKEYGIGGCVQHGASTLPEESFDRFPPTGTVEIHLATGFQNLIYDHPAFPAELKRDVYALVARRDAAERKPGMTDEQFYYKSRKKGFGPFKREMWDMDAAAKGAIVASLEERFKLLMRKLGVPGTRGVVRTHVG